MPSDALGFVAWAHIEAMGHRSHWALVTETTIAGVGVLQIDEYELETDEPVRSCYYPPASIYCLTPCTEATARYNATPFSRRPDRALPQAGGDAPPGIDWDDPEARGEPR